jgi:hypothetical protein
MGCSVKFDFGIVQQFAQESGWLIFAANASGGIH